MLRRNHVAHHVACGAEAHASHADAHEACACSSSVACRGLHGVEHATSGQVTGAASLIFSEEFLTLFVERDRLDGEAHQTDASGADGGVEHPFIHDLFHQLGLAG